MKIECEISVGELVDKLSILRIKLERISNSEKLGHIKKEEFILSRTLNALNLPDIQYHVNQMIEINSRLWNIEDEIREFENDQNFGKEFVEAARLVYKTNDERFERKNTINTIYKSSLVEVKSYIKY
jgi:hypothetical protein